VKIGPVDRDSLSQRIIKT